MGVVEVLRFDVFLVALDPTVGSEIQKTRPCVVISPNEANACIRTVIAAPMTIKSRRYPSRVSLTFKNKQGWIALDQLRTVDKLRLIKKLGSLSESTARKVSDTLVEMFRYS